MSYTIVLADRVGEANAYAKRAPLPRGRWRFASSASSIRGLNVAAIHELPSFARRPDRHSINAELRYTRGERLLVEMPPAPEVPAIDQGDGFGEQLTIDDVLHLTPARADVALDTNTLPVADGSGGLWDPNLAQGPGLSDEEKAELEAILEPEGWEPPDTLSAEDILRLAADPDARGADVLEETHGEETGAPEPSEESAPAAPKRRRSRCKDCGDLDFADTHACPVALRPAPTAPAVDLWD